MTEQNTEQLKEGRDYYSIKNIMKWLRKVSYDNSTHVYTVVPANMSILEDQLKKHSELLHDEIKREALSLAQILAVIPEPKALPKDQRDCGYNQCRDEIVENIQQLYLTQSKERRE